MGEVYFAFNFSIDHHVSILISLLRCEVIDSNHTKLHRKLNIHIEYKVLNITRQFLFRLVTRGTENSGIWRLGFLFDNWDRRRGGGGTAQFPRSL